MFTFISHWRTAVVESVGVGRHRCAVTLYSGRQNVLGIHESSDKALILRN